MGKDDNNNTTMPTDNEQSNKRQQQQKRKVLQPFTDKNKKCMTENKNKHMLSSRLEWEIQSCSEPLIKDTQTSKRCYTSYSLSRALQL